MSDKEDFHKFLAATRAQAEGGVPPQQAANSAGTFSGFAGGLLNRLRFGSKPNSGLSIGPGSTSAVNHSEETSDSSSESAQPAGPSKEDGGRDNNDDDDEEIEERGSLSISVGGQLALSAFVGSVQAAEASLSELQRRHLQAEFLWSYEATRQAKADAMGTEVVAHAQAFARKVDEGVAELDALLLYLEARGAAERVYANALATANSHLQGHDAMLNTFAKVDGCCSAGPNAATPRLSLAATLDASLPEDVTTLLEAFQEARSSSRRELAQEHAQFIKAERQVREHHKLLGKAFNRLLDALRGRSTGAVFDAEAASSGASLSDPTADPWLAEQVYRASLRASNRHAEGYLAALAKWDREVALLGQKRAVAVMCCQKIACFEALRFHETAADQLKVLNETVGEGNTELLQGERTVTDTQSSIVRKHRGSNDGGGNGEDDDEYEEVEPAASSSSSQGSNGGAASAVQRDVKYPFQMALPPPGTHCFEDDLLFLVRDGSSTEASSRSDASLPAPRGLPQLPGDDDHDEGGGGGEETESSANRARRLSVEALLVDSAAAAALGRNSSSSSSSSSGWTSVRAVLTTDRVLHLFDASLPDGTSSSEANSSATSSASGASSAAAALGAALLGGSKNSSAGTEAAARGVVGAQVVRSINCRRASFAVEPIVKQAVPGAAPESTRSRSSSSSGGSSTAALCFEITVASGSLLKKFNNMFSGDGLDHFVFQATNQRQLETWLVLLQDTSIDLANPLAVAAAAEHRQTLASQASGASAADNEVEGDDDESAPTTGGDGGAKDGSGNADAGEGTEGTTAGQNATLSDSLNTSGDAVEARVLEELIDGLDEDLPEVEEIRESIFAGDDDDDGEDALFGLMNEHDSGANGKEDP